MPVAGLFGVIRVLMGMGWDGGRERWCSVGAVRYEFPAVNGLVRMVEAWLSTEGLGSWCSGRRWPKDGGSA